MSLRAKFSLSNYGWKYPLAIFIAFLFITINLVESYHFGMELVIGYTTDTAIHARGVSVLEVQSGYPAEKAGLQPGDLIISVNGKSTENLEKYDSAIANLREGSRATFTVLRGDKEHKLQIEPRRRLSTARFLAGALLVLVYLLVGIICYLKNPD